MPGMNSGLDVTNRVIVAAFRAALMHQGLIAVLLLAMLAIGWASAREWLPSVAAARRRAAPPEPAARMLLRIGFGVLWVFDGILQAQPAMPVGLPSRVIGPAAATSPGWVRHLVSWAGTAWSNHPIQAGAATVWIQVGIGIWLLAAARGPASRMAGLVSAGWGVLVWIFGEAFGGIFAPGLTWLFGAPGAVLCYAVAGLLVALPERCWRHQATGRRMLAALGLFFAGMALLQAWPGRGFWQGAAHGSPGTLTAMVRAMSSTPQPGMLARWVSGFAAFESGHGFAVNVAVVVALAVVGAGLASGRVPLVRAALAVLAVLGLADWALIEDFGFFGGLGTDPNSMIPLLLLAATGYLALARPAGDPAAVPAAAGPVSAASEPAAASPAATATVPAGGAAAVGGAVSTGPARSGGWRARISPRLLVAGFASASLRGVVALWAAAVVFLGAAPMAMAQASPNADPIIAEAIAGGAAPLNEPAPGFSLVSQAGQPVSLASLRGKAVLLTFLDPVCTTDCPLIAQELRAADQLLGARARQLELVAVAANPVYYAVPYLQAFDSQEHLSGLPNWLYLTGPLGQLRQVWKNYGVIVQTLPGGGMVGHNDVAYVIDAAGRIRAELSTDPGPGTASSKSSFAVLLARAAERVLPPGRPS